MQNLQFTTHYTEQYGYADAARLALEGGCRWIQLRMKDASPEEWMRTGAEVEALCRRYSATFILDDHVEWVDVLHADGVHLGKSDMPIDEARRRSEQSDAMRRRRGRRASILTGDTGVGYTPISQRSLIGA